MNNRHFSAVDRMEPYDEPTGSLNSKEGKEVMEMFKEPAKPEQRSSRLRGQKE